MPENAHTENPSINSRRVRGWKGDGVGEINLLKISNAPWETWILSTH